MIKMTLVGFGVELVQSGAGEAQAPAGQPAIKMSMVVAMLMMMVVMMRMLMMMMMTWRICILTGSQRGLALLAHSTPQSTLRSG